MVFGKTGFIDLFFGFINNPTVPWVLAVLIFIVAVYAWICFCQKLKPISRSAQDGQKTLSDHPVQEFSLHYEELNASLSQDQVFKHVWKTFSRSLILPRGDNELIRHTDRAAAYFNEATLIAERVNLRFYQAVPNILVGIGLLFTFIGLVAALYFASRGLAASNIADAQRALGDLLHAATFKFVTSIAGLLASLVFSWCEKHHLHRVQGEIEQFCQSLEERLNFVTPEQIAWDQFCEARKQTEQLERFNTDLAVAISNALDDKFQGLNTGVATSLQVVSQALVEEIRRLGDRFGDKNQQALEELLRTFSDKLTAGAGQELVELRGTLEHLVRTLGDNSNRLHQQTDEVVKGVDMLGQSLQSMLTRIGQDLSQGASEAGTILQNGITQGLQTLQEATKNFGASVNQLEQITTNAKNSGTVMLQVRDELLTAYQKLDSVTNPLMQATNQITEMLSTLERQSQSSYQACNNLQALSASLQETTTKIAATWDIFCEWFERTNEQAEKVFREMQQGGQLLTVETAAALEKLAAMSKVLEEVPQKIKDNLHQGAGLAGATFSEEIGKGARVLQETIHAFGDSISKLEKVANEATQSESTRIDLQNQMQATVQALEQATHLTESALQKVSDGISTLSKQSEATRATVEQVKNLTASLENASAGIHKTWQSYSQRFDQVDEHAARMFTEINTGLQAYTEQIKSFVTGIDEHMANATSALGGAVEELGQRLEDLSDIIDRKGR